MQKIIFFIALITFSITVFAEKLTVAAFDVGSGTTKLVVATLDTDAGTFKIIDEQSEKVGYADDLEKNQSDVFSEQIKTQGFNALTSLKKIAVDKGATRFFAVATQAFRASKNAKSFIDGMNEKGLGITILIIDQNEEAELGYLAATAGETKKIENIVVWDIGGGSMQFAYTDTKGNFKTYGEQIGSVAFANFVKQIQNKPSDASPNPINEIEFEKTRSQTMEKVQGKLGNELDLDLVARISSPDTLVIGIGGVHYYSIRGQIKAESNNYSSDDIDTAIGMKLGMTDEDIDSKYASTEVSNLIMVLAYMQALNVQEVKPKKINPAHGSVLRFLDSSEPVRFFDEKNKEWVRIDGQSHPLKTVDELEALLNDNEESASVKAFKKSIESEKAKVVKTQTKFNIVNGALYLGLVILLFIVAALYRRRSKQ